jgi:hypothetical protein
MTSFPGQQEETQQYANLGEANVTHVEESENKDLFRYDWAIKRWIQHNVILQNENTHARKQRAIHRRLTPEHATEFFMNRNPRGLYAILPQSFPTVFSCQ